MAPVVRLVRKKNRVFISFYHLLLLLLLLLLSQLFNGLLPLPPPPLTPFTPTLKTVKRLVNGRLGSELKIVETRTKLVGQ